MLNNSEILDTEKSSINIKNKLDLIDSRVMIVDQDTFAQMIQMKFQILEEEAQTIVLLYMQNFVMQNV